MYEARQNKEGIKGKVSRTLSPSIQKHKHLICDDCNPIVLKNQKILQLQVDTTNFEKSINSHYLVNPNNRTLLYSIPTAEMPMPTKLYDRIEDKNEENSSLYVWKPNVHFFDLDLQNKVVNQKIQKNDLLELKNNVEKTDETTPCLPAEIGVISRNDCDFFATKLQELIAYDKLTSQSMNSPQREFSTITNINDYNDNIEIQVGDKIKHIYENDTATANYHSITVVAKDGESIISLEADVDQQQWKHPQFRIRNGVVGFINENNTENGENRKLGYNVEITPFNNPYMSITNLERNRLAYKEIYNNTIKGKDITNILTRKFGLTDTEYARNKKKSNECLLI